MSAVASKNLYELLGNDHDEDSDKEPEPPVKVVDKTPARTTKRNAPDTAPASKAGVPPAVERAPRRGGGPTGNEGAFRDRTAGAANNRAKPVGETDQPPRGHGTYEGRGRGRGGGGPRRVNLDRHSRGVVGDSEKQVAHGWGATEGEAELADEKAGEQLADEDKKEALVGDGDDKPIDAAEAAGEAEPEDNSKSYEQYLAELAEKKLALGTGIPEARKPNEGSKQDKKWANAKALEKDDQEDFVSGSASKAKRERERKQKQVVEIDQRFVEAPERGGRGGFRGGDRGGFRGGDRGDRRGRGDGSGRGRGEFRGRGDRGGRGRGDGSFRGRGGAGPRGGSGNSGAAINTTDESAFPSLGS